MNVFGMKVELKKESSRILAGEMPTPAPIKPVSKRLQILRNSRGPKELARRNIVPDNRTEERKNKVFEGMRMGLPVSEAIVASGIAAHDWYKWLRTSGHNNTRAAYRSYCEMKFGG